ncbi:MAG: class I SAM-dependent methyltransferase [Spirochaetia bacterium]|nr:class I SAM-dependent methyltransferase [Spirochaetia bacterium]
MKLELMLCAICQSNLHFKFSKLSEDASKSFNIYKCKNCKNWQIYPVPDPLELHKLYELDYFSKRTKRGYDNYAGEAVKKSVISTLVKNLTDLDFYSWEKNLNDKSSLEIGAAAGHCVGYLQERGWEACGIDISKSMTDAARKNKIQMIHGDFLTYNFKNTKFDLISLWATLEHLPDPNQYIEKISKLLKPDGHLYLTTTNTGFWAKIYRKKWRYLNVPEHIYYFNKKSLVYLFNQSNLKIHHAFTYGSGFTSKYNMSIFLKVIKFIADRLAKFFYSGDMIVLDVVHSRSTSL